MWEEGKLAASLLYGDSSTAPSLALQQGGDWLHPSILISTCFLLLARPRGLLLRTQFHQTNCSLVLFSYKLSRPLEVRLEHLSLYIVRDFVPNIV